ncbi:MAG TPA: hypothetical protein VH108_05955 [Gaiellaceae bacterium]|jgi:hypothetical protein|nr:hypothetical protein [Gaiellaceae bacterium]
MLRDLWSRITGRSREAAVEREIERERGSPADRRLASESVDDFQADEFVAEHLGGVEPERLAEDEPPRT